MFISHFEQMHGHRLDIANEYSAMNDEQ